MLHDHSVFGVILSARHTYFEQVEYIINACELEGVEVWLVADFFSTQISRTSFDELLGHPLLIFRTAPEASWQSLVKQLMDLCGALLLLLLSVAGVSADCRSPSNSPRPARFFSGSNAPG